jgi:hypothetical protein
MAQTTSGTSFGPVFVVVTFLTPPRRVFCTLQADILVSIRKYEKKKEENLRKAQTTHLESFGPVLVVAAFPTPLRRAAAAAAVGDGGFWASQACFGRCRVSERNLL